MRHLLSARDLTHDEAVLVLDTAEQMAATQAREIKKLPTLRGRTVVNLFFEDSTRTRISFETAAKRLSADVLNFSAKGSSVSKGESLKDTAQTIQAMGVDAERSLRVSVGWDTTDADVDRLLAALPEVLDDLRALGGRA